MTCKHYQTVVVTFPYRKSEKNETFNGKLNAGSKPFTHHITHSIYKDNDLENVWGRLWMGAKPCLVAYVTLSPSLLFAFSHPLVQTKAITLMVIYICNIIVFPWKRRNKIQFKCSIRRSATKMLPITTSIYEQDIVVSSCAMHTHTNEHVCLFMNENIHRTVIHTAAVYTKDGKIKWKREIQKNTGSSIEQEKEETIKYGKIQLRNILK